jgi:hypothetical protein
MGLLSRSLSVWSNGERVSTWTIPALSQMDYATHWLLIRPCPVAKGANYSFRGNDYTAVQQNIGYCRVGQIWRKRFEKFKKRCILSTFRFNNMLILMVFPSISLLTREFWIGVLPQVSTDAKAVRSCIYTPTG